MTRLYKLYYILVFPIFSLFHRVRQKGRENIPPGAALICGNHTSLKDPVLVAIAAGFGHFIRFMAKDELMRIPVFGYLLKKVGTFGVKRGQADIKSIKTALSILKSGGKVGIFPEGHRVESDEDSEAKNGVIMLAAKTGAPIVPVYIPREKKLFRSVEVVIGKPYHIDKIMAGSESYSVYARELMQKIEELKP